MADPIPLNSAFSIADGEASAYNRRQYGVFGQNPASTPKYMLGQPRDAEFKDTLARMFVSIPPDSVQAYRDSLPPDKRVQALAQILAGNGNASSTGSTGFIDFFLQQINESFQEKLQIDEVMGDNYVAFYFGQAPPVFQYSGTLLNTMQDDQTTGFALAYQAIFRGTQLARTGALLRLRYDNVIVSGTVNSYSRVINAESEMACPFNFSLLVKEYIVLPATRYSKLSLQDFVQLQSAFDVQNKIASLTAAQDTRIRLTLILPPVLKEAPVVGQDAPATPVDSTKPPPQQVDSLAAQQYQSPVATGIENPTTLTSQSTPPEFAPNASLSTGGP